MSIALSQHQLEKLWTVVRRFFAEQAGESHLRRNISVERLPGMRREAEAVSS